jgi:DNA helicase-2/ATP-dependent DNA helicase PcrA
MNEILANLNQRQREAVVYGLNEHGDIPPPLLILAGAGTGKTKTLTHRAAQALVIGADPNRMLMMTFTRKAANEMCGRVSTVVSRALRVQSDIKIEWAGTFHAMGARLLREYADSIGLDPNFNIHDRADSEDLLDLVRHELGLASAQARFPQKSTCMSIYSRAVNAQLDLEEVLGRWFPWCAKWEAELRTLFIAYVTAKQEQRVLDYDDLLLYWSKMSAVPEIAAEIGGRFDHVMVDEYQDTNVLQASILMAMKPQGHGLTVVGDDGQSIYSFRSAQVENILTFPEQFQPHAKIITLNQNYRSTPGILSSANAVLALARRQHQKELWSEKPDGEKPALVIVRDENAQAAYVADKVLQNREEGDRLQDQAVLFRASHHSGPLEIELSRKGIPYRKFGGLKFLEAAHIKDILAILKWATNLKDQVAGFRVLKLMPGIGPATAKRIMGEVAGAPRPIEVVRAHNPPPASKGYWSGFREMIECLQSPLVSWPNDVSIVQDWYSPVLELLYDDPVSRAADIDQLAMISGTFSSREKFLSDLTLDLPDVTSDLADDAGLDEDYLILSTVHSAKGLEYRRVFVLNVVDGSFPSDLAIGEEATIEEERRLLYVAMTRAKSSLYLLQPRAFHVKKQQKHGDRHVLAAQTRFIPEAIIRLFERTSWPITTNNEAPFVPLRSPVDIAKTVGGMWEK